MNNHKRKRIDHLTRRMVHRRDGWACKHCGDNVEQVSLHVDHITPLALGGDNSFSNLQTLCSTCNLIKGSKYVG